MLSRNSSFRASLARCVALSATLVAAPAVVRAQTATVPPAVDSAAPSSGAHVLQSVTVTASRRAPTLAEEGILGRIVRVDNERRQVIGLMVGNRKLAAQIVRQGEEITRLETRLNYLMTTVTDSLNQEIADAERATADTREQRMALEARLDALDARQVAARATAEALGYR